MAELGANSHTIGVVLNHILVRRGTVTSAVYVQYAYDNEKCEALEQQQMPPAQCSRRVGITGFRLSRSPAQPGTFGQLNHAL